MSLKIDRRLWHSSTKKEHQEFKTLLYQFQENGAYNEVYFKEVEQEAGELVNDLFNKQDNITLFINQELKQNKTYRPIVKKIFYDMKAVKISGQIYTYQEDGSDTEINQLILKTIMSNIKWSVLVNAIIHEDFPDRKPRFPRGLTEDYPDIYIFNQKTKEVLYIYDDRGYELYVLEASFFDIY